MTRKITFPELTALLSEQTGETKKRCEVFLKQFFAAIIDSLVEGEVVKIKDLGTFRLVEVGSRKSVNVNTGMDIEIPGHRRVSFVAAKSLAEKINAPFEAFESVELSDDVSEEELNKIDDTAVIDIEEEALDTPADSSKESTHSYLSSEPIEQSPLVQSEEQLPKEEMIDEVVQDDMDEHVYSLSTDDDEPLSEAPAEVEDTEPEKQEYVDDEDNRTAEDPEEIPEEQSEDAIEDITEENVEDDLLPSDYSFALKEDENPGESPAKETQAAASQGLAASAGSTNQLHNRTSSATLKSRPHRKDNSSGQFGFGFITGILSTIIVAAVVFALIFNRNSIFSFDQKVDNKKDSTALAELPIPHDSITPIAEVQAIDTVQPGAGETAMEAVELEPVKEEVKTEKEKSKVADTKPSDAPIYDTITKKRFLTTMAKQHYGNYHLWPYIYEANKSLGHPDRIRPGTKILVPSLSSLGIDPKNPTVIANAKKKGAAIYARYK